MNVRAEQSVLDRLMQDFWGSVAVGQPDRGNSHGTAVAKRALRELQPSGATVVRTFR